MSDWGNGQGWLRDDELAHAGCGRDCHCTSTMCRMARELRTLRAQALTDEEMEALEFARGCVYAHQITDAKLGNPDGSAYAKRISDALSVLSRLAKGGE